MDAITAYIRSFPEPTQQLLHKIRTIILDTAPDAEESISYAMPAYKAYGKPLVYFAAYKHHIGFYATPTGHEAFEQELSGYKQGRGSVQFPLDQPVPYDLIKQIVRFKLKENERLSVRNPGMFPDALSTPAQRALAQHNITTSEQLAQFTEKELLSLHGIGKTSIPRIREILARQGLKLKE